MEKQTVKKLLKMSPETALVLKAMANRYEENETSLIRRLILEEAERKGIRSAAPDPAQ